jgi:hypothetical protein
MLMERADDDERDALQVVLRPALPRIAACGGSALPDLVELGCTACALETGSGQRMSATNGDARPTEPLRRHDDACPLCGGQLVTVRAEMACSRCGRICEGCCEGTSEGIPRYEDRVMDERPWLELRVGFPADSLEDAETAPRGAGAALALPQRLGGARSAEPDVEPGRRFRRRLTYGAGDGHAGLCGALDAPEAEGHCGPTSVRVVGHRMRRLHARPVGRRRERDAPAPAGQPRSHRLSLGRQPGQRDGR